MVKSACIGFCRSLDNKKLYDLVYGYLFGNGEIGEQKLLEECKKMRIENWKVQKKYDTDIILSNDFTMFDRMLDTICFVGNIPRKYYWEGGKVPLEIYFSMAFGKQKDKFDVEPLVTKNWLQTNYLYYVPEFSDPIEFAYSDNKSINEAIEAMSIGINSHIVILSPMSYLLLGRTTEDDINVLDLLEDVLPVYNDFFKNCRRIGIKNIQLEDPMIFKIEDENIKNKYKYCYKQIREYADDIELNLVSYNYDLTNVINFLSTLEVNSIHLDIPYNEKNIENIKTKIRKGMKVSLGVVDGGDIWKNNLNKSLDIVSSFCDTFGEENIIISNSCPMFLIPSSTKNETLPESIANKVSFGIEKLEEIRLLKTAINKGKSYVAEELKENEIFFKQNNRHARTFKASYRNDNRNNRINKKISDIFKNAGGENKVFTTLAGNIGNSNDNVNVQNNSHLSCCSLSVLKDGYDASMLSDSIKHTYTLKNNFLPRSGFAYYAPNIIFNEVSFDNNKDLTNKILNEFSHTSKLTKLSLCSPNHYLNFSFISPFIDYDKVKTTLEDAFLKFLHNFKNKVDIIQINDLSLFTNYSQYRNKIGVLDNNSFLNKIDDEFKCKVFYTHYSPNTDIVNLCEGLSVDLLILESSDWQSDLLHEFIFYRPKIPICFDLFNPKTIRLPSKFKMYAKIQKIIHTIGDGDLAFCIGNDIPNWFEDKKVSSIISIFHSSIEEAYKKIGQKHNNKTTKAKKYKTGTKSSNKK